MGLAPLPLAPLGRPARSNHAPERKPMTLRGFVKRGIVLVGTTLAAVVALAAPAHATGCEGGGTGCYYYYASYSFQTQETYYNCGPASTRLALTALGYYPAQGRAGDSVSSGTVAGMLHTTTDGTDSIYNVTYALNTMGHTSWYESKLIHYPVPSSELSLLKSDVYYDIARDHVIVANVIGHEYDDAGVYHNYATGHYLTVVGFTQNGADVLIEDVAIASTGRHQYWMSAVNLADWIANKGYSA
jgi:hypothetical protein